VGQKHAELEMSRPLRELMEVYVPPLLQFVQCDGKPAIGNNALFQLRNCLVLIDCFLRILRTPVHYEAADGEDAKDVDPLDHTLYFSPFCEGWER
jgi:hypothetical protein